MIAAPFTGIRGEVRPEWILPGNPHLNLAYYLVLFDAASQAFFTELDMSGADPKGTGFSFFAAETHTIYEREMYLGDQALVSTTLMDADEKRIHLAHEMYRPGEAARIALLEIMYVSVNLANGRASPWPEDVLARIMTAKAAHDSLPRPAKTGRHVGIRRI